MSPRPKVDRVPRAVRLTRPTDEVLVAEAERRGISVNQAIELAVIEWAKR